MDHGTLWLGHQTRALMMAVKADLIAEFGDEEDRDRPNLTIAAGWPYSANDRKVTFDGLAWKRELDAKDPSDGSEWRFDPVPLTDDERAALASLESS